MSKILEGIKVIDFTHVWQGPIATQILGDFGADVIKIERPGMGDWSRGYGPYARELSLVFACLNRNKRSVVVDIRSEKGKEIIYRFLKDADVLVHNFRPCVDKKLALDYETLRKLNPRLIHAHSSGWGDEGPYVAKQKKGHADMAAATGGLFIMEGKDGVPISPGYSIDYPAGMLLTQAILLAIIEREKSGVGQQVSTDLLSAAVFARTWLAGKALNPQYTDTTDKDFGITQNAIRSAWKTKDGFIEVSPVFSTDALRDISVAMDLGDLSLDPRFETAQKRYANKSDLEAIFEKRFLEKTTQEWMETFEGKGVLCAEINTMEQAFNDPQVLANKMVVEMEHPKIGQFKVLGSPIRLDRTPASYDKPPPLLGEQTEEVLREYGYSEKEIQFFRENKVIA